MSLISLFKYLLDNLQINSWGVNGFQKGVKLSLLLTYVKISTIFWIKKKKIIFCSPSCLIVSYYYKNTLQKHKYISRKHIQSLKKVKSKIMDFCQFWCIFSFLFSQSDEGLMKTSNTRAMFVCLFVDFFHNSWINCGHFPAIININSTLHDDFLLCWKCSVENDWIFSLLSTYH